MNYEKMSDFEINKAVAVSLGGMYARRETANSKSVEVVFDHARAAYDYCNNPADAWPVIFENRIAINPAGKLNGTNRSKNTWRAGDGSVYHARDDNPLRAAMIVFLMMQEQEK